MMLRMRAVPVGLFVELSALVFVYHSETQWQTAVSEPPSAAEAHYTQQNTNFQPLYKVNPKVIYMKT